MAFQWVSYFECLACGERDRADAVDYDSLGYPACPACGARTGPLSDVERRGATGKRDAPASDDSSFEFGVFPDASSRTTE
jgi:hypothetical protein